ncbi:uncharacterized protein LOC123532908 [Mercenaria mercenaria]|uniref:uncharacterized protein LOC123532908 n=1 Tax=Mercenaria mercenaria TaxID=6596 RepID=UPI00234E9A93|nr:uncharacterized protein LOC123532908 [Mercenaria mercenaria]
MYVILLLAVWCFNVQGNEHRRFVLDENANLTTLVAKLVSEVEELKSQQASSSETVSLLQQEVQQLNQDISKSTIKQTTQSQGSWSTYIRWGKSTCPTDQTELVYSGYAAGSHWNDAGAATNFICLVKDPYLVGNGSFNQGAQVYGAEYVIDNANWQETSQRLFQRDISFHNVPCAVCRVPRSTVILLPGKNTCTAGWTFEYEGVLSSGYYGHKAGSEFVCLDKDPEAVPGGNSKQLGKLFYLVEAVCGSLQCPPYESGKELTCSVCSK